MTGPRYRWGFNPVPETTPAIIPVPDLDTARRRDAPVVAWIEATIGRALPDMEASTTEDMAPVLVRPDGRPVVVDLTPDELWVCWWHLQVHDALRLVASLYGGLFNYLEAGELEAARLALAVLVDRLLWAAEGMAG